MVVLNSQKQRSAEPSGKRHGDKKLPRQSQQKKHLYTSRERDGDKKPPRESQHTVFPKEPRKNDPPLNSRLRFKSRPASHFQDPHPTARGESDCSNDTNVRDRGLCQKRYTRSRREPREKKQPCPRRCGGDGARRPRPPTRTRIATTGRRPSPPPVARRFSSTQSGPRDARQTKGCAAQALLRSISAAAARCTVLASCCASASFAEHRVRRKKQVNCTARTSVQLVLPK